MSDLAPFVFLPEKGESSHESTHALRYEIVLFPNETISESTQHDWIEKRRALTNDLATARMSGKKTKASEIETTLESLFDQFLAPELTKNAAKEILSSQQRLAIADFISKCAVNSLAWAILPSQIHWILELTGEVSLPEVISQIKNLTPEVNWAKNEYIPLLNSESAFEEAITRLHSISLQTGICPNKVLAEENSLEDNSSTSSATIDFHHISVLLHETVEMLEPKPGKIILDATLGGGGHSEALLEAGAKVIGLDQDPSALLAAGKRLARFGQNFIPLHGNFRNLTKILSQAGFCQVDGILADIGVSSHQIDTPERGFSFREDGPLDMRMNPTCGQSAADIVNFADAKEIADILYQFGEERESRRIASAILRQREKAPFKTTSQLAECIASVLKKTGPHHPATRSFQALRIAVNDELGALDALLAASPTLLAPNGRLAIITFHSLEDRRVKQFFDLHSRPEIDRPEWPAPRPNPDFHFHLISRRPISASPAELENNPRSRSAKLRGVIRIS